MMTTRRRDPGGSWWWAGGGGDCALTENERRRRDLAAEEVAAAVAQTQQEVDADIFQLSYPRPRLRWTAELHDKFLKAVDQLGGANKATPKAILNLMDVEGLTLFHLKSHLQKFRLGKTGRRLWRKEFIPANYYLKRDDMLPPLNLEAQPPNSFPTAYFDMNGGQRIGAETYGNLNLLIEPQAAVEKFDATSQIPALTTAEQAATTADGMKMEEEIGAKPPLLPLFPACGTMNYYSSDWSEYLEGGGRKSVGLNASMVTDDDYLNSLGYSSAEFAPDSCRASTVYGTFFDEVDSFSKVHDDAVSDPNVGEPYQHLSSGVGHYYP